MARSVATGTIQDAHTQCHFYKPAKDWTLNGFNAPLILNNIKLHCGHLTFRCEDLSFKWRLLKKKKGGAIKRSMAQLIKMRNCSLLSTLSFCRRDKGRQRNLYKKTTDDSTHEAATQSVLNHSLYTTGSIKHCRNCHQYSYRLKINSLKVKIIVYR